MNMLTGMTMGTMTLRTKQCRDMHTVIGTSMNLSRTAMPMCQIHTTGIAMESMKIRLACSSSLSGAHDIKKPHKAFTLRGFVLAG
jgi:hypothetical protein